MANRIEILRNAASLKRTELATALDVTERTIYRWERDDVQIPDEQKLELSRVLNTSVAFLMGWDQPYERQPRSNGSNGGNGDGDDGARREVAS